MPSIKNPNDVVLPGDGLVQDGASSSLVTAASTVSVPPIGSPGFWETAGNVEQALITAYNGLNARAVYVVDGNANPDSDFTSLSVALSTVTGVRKAIFYLRPGNYDISATPNISNCTIIGRSPGDCAIINNSGDITISGDAQVGGVLIQTSGDLNIGTSVGERGFSKVTNVVAKVSGNVNVKSSGNTIEGIVPAEVYAMFGSNLLVSVQGSENTIRRVITSQLVVTGNRCILDDITIGGFNFGSFTNLPPKVGGNPELEITGNDNTIRTVAINPTSLITGNAVLFSGSRNRLSSLSVTINLNGVKDIIAYGASATHNVLADVNITNTIAASGCIIRLPAGADSNEIRNVRVATPTIAATFSFCRIASNSNLVSGLDFSGASGSPDSLIEVTGSNNTIENVASSCRPLGSYIKFNGSNNKLAQYSQAAAAFSAGTHSWVRLDGAGHQVSSLRASSLTAVQCPLVFINSPDSSVDKVELDSIASTATGFQMIHMTTSNSTVKNITLQNSPTLGTGSGLVFMNGCISCVVDGVTLISIGSSSAPPSLITSTGNTLANHKCVIRNVSSSGAFLTATMFDLEQGPWPGLLLEGIQFIGSLDCPVVRIRNTGIQFNGTQPPIVIQDSTFLNSGTSALSHALRIQNFGSSAVVQRCWLRSAAAPASHTVTITNATPAVVTWSTHGLAADSQVVFTTTGTLPTGLLENIIYYVLSAGLTTNTFRVSLTPGGAAINTSSAGSGTHTATTVTAGVQVIDSADVSFVDCVIQSEGLATIACGASNTGSKFTRCRFIGPSGFADSSTQLFYGWGVVGHTVFPNSPLVLRDCQMLLGKGNNDPFTGSLANIFLGGYGLASALDHGAIIVDGLIIGRNPEDAFTFWHRAPTLAIDVLSQPVNVSSSFANITVDLEGTNFATVDATSSAPFSPVTLYVDQAWIVGINGPNSAILDSTSRQTTVTGLSILRLPRGGGAGSRSALIASGCAIKNLTIDVMDGPAPTVDANQAWHGAALAVDNCTVSDASLYDTASLFLGFSLASSVIFADNNSLIERLSIRNFSIENAGLLGQVTVVGLSNGSHLKKSYIEMQDGAVWFNGTGIGDGAPLVGVTGSDGSITENTFIFTRHATSSSDMTIAVDASATNAVVSGNIIRNQALSTAASYPNLGGGALINASGDGVTVSGNSQDFQWESNLTQISSIESSGSYCKILNNVTINTATQVNTANGGGNRIRFTNGKFSSFIGNYVQANNVTGGTRIQIATSAADHSFVSGNTLRNTRSGGGAPNLSNGTDKPDPTGSTLADFNWVLTLP